MTGQAKKIMVGLGAKGADKAELDRLTMGLINELRQTQVESAERATKGAKPAGTKGDPFTIGWLAVTLTPIVAKKVFDILVDWTKRARDRSIKVTIGTKSIELSAASGKEREKLLNTWLKEVNRGHKNEE